MISILWGPDRTFFVSLDMKSNLGILSMYLNLLNCWEVAIYSGPSAFVARGLTGFFICTLQTHRLKVIKLLLVADVWVDKVSLFSGQIW